MKTNVKRYNVNISLLVLFVVLSENGMYLINTSKLNISGSFNYNDMWTYILVFYELYFLLKYKMNKKYAYKFEVAGIIACCVISGFQSSLNVGQPLMMGIRPQRFFIICFLSYFVVRKQLALKKMKAVDILDLLVTMGTIEGILCAMQYFLYGHIIFLYADANMRYGSVRLYFDSGLMMFTTIVGWCFFLRKGKFKYLFSMGMGMVYEFLISKGRLENMCILFSLFLAYIILRKAAFRKVMMLLTLISVIVLLMNTSYSQILINSAKSFLTDTESSETNSKDDTGDTMAVRKEGREYYSEQLNKSTQNFILGCGYPNSLCEKAVAYARADTYSLNDNGIFGYAYVYGMLGLTFVGILVLKIIIDSIRVYIRTSSLFPISYITFLIPIAYNIIFWWWKPDSTLLLGIYLAIVDHYTHDKEEKDEYIL